VRIFRNTTSIFKVSFTEGGTSNIRNEFVCMSYFIKCYIARMLTTHTDLHAKGKIIGISKILSCSLRSVKTMRVRLEENSGC
jgi:hypothetical protein